MKHLFIINPAAGAYDHTVEFSKAIGQYFSNHPEQSAEICISKQPGDCAAIAKKACETGEALRIYACGGDGTLNETIQGVVGYSNAAVTHFPGGSGNDFIKIFSEPSAFFNLEALVNGQETTFDLIQDRKSTRLNSSPLQKSSMPTSA